MAEDTINWQAHLGVRRWDADQVDYARAKTGILEPTAADLDALRLTPYSETEVANNLLTTAGVTRVVSLLNGAGGIAVTSTTARVGTGNGAGSAVVADTDLGAAAGAANRWFNLCTVSISAGVLTATSSFASADGNYAWNEWGIDIGAATVTASAVVNATLLNHKTGIAQGTKAAGQVWSATATITIS